MAQLSAFTPAQGIVICSQGRVVDGREPVRCLKGGAVVDHTTRTVLAAVAAIEDDEEFEIEPTAKAVADRAGVPRQRRLAGA